MISQLVAFLMLALAAAVVAGSRHLVAAGQPALTAIPVGGKALFRYAETVADARSTGTAKDKPRDLLVEYVIIGSFASWGQATLLALVILGGST